MSPAEIASAEQAVRGLVGADVARLLRPVLRVEHAAVMDVIGRLPWGTDPVEVVASAAVAMLAHATRPGGPVDPADDDSDVPWARTLIRVVGAPVIGAKSARRWFAHLERSLWEDMPVSSVAQAVAAYAVARFEDAMGRDHDAWWWMQMGAAQAEADERVGLGVAVVVRAAHLLAWRE
jgi:hypothetical protein